jgi:hypothetical protein
MKVFSGITGCREINETVVERLYELDEEKIARRDELPCSDGPLELAGGGDVLFRSRVGGAAEVS